MKPISAPVWSRLSLRAGSRVTVVDVASSPGRVVRTYVDLVQAVAEVSYRNREYMPLYRGQTQDYMSRKSLVKLSSIIPSIYRPQQGYDILTSQSLARRFSALDTGRDELIYTIGRLPDKSDFRLSDFRDFDEIAWAVFQHYRILPTPLIDLTQSLMVACSFALQNNHSRFGYVYLVGVESMSPTVFVSYHGRHQLIRLGSLMPKTARRPLHQEGYLVGNYPIRKTQRGNNNLAYRMLAKYRIPTKGFWSRNYQPIPTNALLPKNDQMEKLLAPMRSKYEHLW